MWEIIIFNFIYMKKYTKPPLPFMGAKKNCIKHIEAIIQDFKNQNLDYEKYIFVDLFGGSGFLSHTIKYFLPKNKIIWNDFENYQKRLNSIGETEEIRKKIFTIIKHKKVKEKIVEKEIQEKILEIFAKNPDFDKKTLASWLIFDGNMKELYKKNWYHKIPKNPIFCDGYLEGVERRSIDYEELFNEFKNMKKVFFLFDPPYLNTQSGNYKIINAWNLSSYLNIAEKLFSLKHFLFFTSESSSMIEFVRYLEKFFGKITFKQKEYKSTIGKKTTKKEYILYKI